MIEVFSRLISKAQSMFMADAGLLAKLKRLVRNAVITEGGCKKGNGKKATQLIF